MYPDPPTTAARYAIGAVYTQLHIYATVGATRSTQVGEPSPRTQRIKWARSSGVRPTAEQFPDRVADRLGVPTPRPGEGCNGPTARR